MNADALKLICTTNQLLGPASRWLNLDLEIIAGAGVLHEGGDQVDDAFQIAEVDRFDRRVHVAVRDADGDGRNAAALTENGIRIGAGPTGIDAALERDLVLRRELFEAVDNDRMIHAAAAEDGTFTESRVAEFFLVRNGDVRRLTDVHHERRIGPHGIADHGRAVETVLFLHSGSGDETRLELLLVLGAQTHDFRRDERADAIVAGAGDVDVIVELLEADRVGDQVTHRDALFGGLAVLRADVDEHLVPVGHLAFLRAVLHVDRERANHAEHRSVAAMNVYALTASQRGVGTADGLEIEKAVVVNVLDLKADFVRMAHDHDFRMSAGIHNREGIAVSIGFHAIGELFHVVDPDALTGGFRTGRAGGFEQLREKFERGFFHGTGRVLTQRSRVDESFLMRAPNRSQRLQLPDSPEAPRAGLGIETDSFFMSLFKHDLSRDVRLRFAR